MTSRNNYISLANLRLDWANTGLDRLEELVGDFLATSPCEVVENMEREGESAHFSYTLHILSQPPPTISFAVGDIVHNLRATLDNLVWSIGKVSKVHDDIGLEFYLSKTNFLDTYNPKISKLPQSIYDWIESIQPYHRRHYIKLFYILHRLWNRDKHRTPTLIVTIADTSTLGDSDEVLPFDKMTFHNPSGREDQEQIMSAVVPWERRNDFKPKFTTFIAFDETGVVGRNILGCPESVIPYLRHIHEYILENVILLFEHYLS